MPASSRFHLCPETAAALVSQLLPRGRRLCRCSPDHSSLLPAAFPCVRATDQRRGFHPANSSKSIQQANPTDARWPCIACAYSEDLILNAISPPVKPRLRSRWRTLSRTRFCPPTEPSTAFVIDAALGLCIWSRKRIAATRVNVTALCSYTNRTAGCCMQC